MILPVSFPSSVISMLLLMVLLLSRFLKQEHIKETTDFLLANLSLFFVPIIVDVVDNLSLIKGILFPIFFICVITTFLTFVVTAYTVTGMTRLMERRQGENYE